ncbi:MAG TPA: hypothetical protein VG142_00830 [Trebonia sp.]|nr:hypothetical protein [Trebonia sp.]
MTWLAPVSGGHQTTVADALPPMARASVGAPTAVASASALLVAGQDASVPDGCDCALAMAAAEALLAEAVFAESVLAEAVFAETVLAETVLAETVLAETVLAETVLADALPDAAPVSCGTARATSTVAALTAVVRKRRETPLFISVHPQSHKNGKL